MIDIYGPATDANNLNVRISANYVGRGKTIPRTATVRIMFDSPTPASGLAFAVTDIDVDQVRYTADNDSGNNIPTSQLSNWFIEVFDGDPDTDGVNTPKWDPSYAPVVGASSKYATWQTRVEGNLEDTENGAAWFQPNVSLSELTFKYQSLQDKAEPSFHLLMATCASVVAPAPTPTPSADDDGDSIPNSIEGTEDDDDDGVPNYEDLDSDDNTISDQLEGDDDDDGDLIPNFLDKDSDGDDILDEVERDPLGDPDDATGTDNDQNGIDDGRESDTIAPLEDTDNDGTPDTLDEDSDDDGISDGEEAYDLDGDGDRDVEESGDDNNQNGVDDSFEDFTDPEDLNPDFAGEESQAPCSDLGALNKKNKVTKKLNALANRVGQFAAKARDCGDNSLSSLAQNSKRDKNSFHRALADAFQDNEVLCPVETCARLNRSEYKDTLLSLATEIYRDAKRAKTTAIKACNVVHAPSQPDNRPNTEAYLSDAKSAIIRLPTRVSRCD